MKYCDNENNRRYKNYSVAGKTTKEIFFTRRIFHDLRGEKQNFNLLMQISNEIALAQQTIASHPFALKVLSSFGIQDIFDSKIIGGVLEKLAESEPEKLSQAAQIAFPLFQRWDSMLSCAKPWEDLTVPNEVSREKQYDEILTIEILRPENSDTTLDTLRTVIADIEKLYQSFLVLHKKVEIEPLRIIYIASGSSLRVDLKGLGDPIKQIKNLLVEGWSLWRHRKSTELEHNARALLTSLKTFSEIDKQVKNGSMSKPDGEALKARMQKAMIGMFGEGALPREVPTIENLSNLMLAELNSQKQLTLPKSDSQASLETSESLASLSETNYLKSPTEQPITRKPIKRLKSRN